MKIKKIVHHEKTRWRVNDPQGPDGKRQRKFFDTREAATRYARQRNEDRRAYGIRFATIPPSERASLGYAKEEKSGIAEIYDNRHLK